MPPYKPIQPPDTLAPTALPDELGPELADQALAVQGIEALRAGAPPATSDEREERTSLAAPPPDAPSTVAGEVGVAQDLSGEQRATLGALYGEGFPLLAHGNPTDDDWARWASELWNRHAPGVRARLHLTQRNRLFRRGIQWISAIGLGPWREPPKPRDAARVVDNLIGPALDQRTQIVSEQRPGFNTRPSTQDPNDLKKAEAQQYGLEYQYDQQDMLGIIREMHYWAGTDGCAFGEVYWDPEAGPWHDLRAEPASAQSATQDPHNDHTLSRIPIGDLKTRVLRIEQVRVSAEATSTRKPWYWVLREVIPKAQAIKDYGVEVGGQMNEGGGDATVDSRITQTLTAKGGFLLPSEDELYREQTTVDRLTVYCDRSEYLPKGLSLIVVGKKVVFVGPLLFGMPPVFRMTDGSSDPAFYPTPIMDSWIDAQMRINAIKSKWVENIRFNAGAKLLSRENAIAGETLTGGTMSVISVKGIGPITDSVKPLEGFPLGGDAKELLALEKKAFEDLSGFNDTSRGSFSADQSGRAILAIREQLERVFAPPVQAAARAMTDWARITIAGMHWGYDLPRTVATLGHGRPDLARELQSEDFDGACDVWIDPETLMPMPRALRLFLLKDLAQMGIIDAQEYRRRLPFAWTRSIGTPDQDHEARARRCAEAIRQTGNPQVFPILWQDNEAIHQDVLERELILPDDTPPQIREAALQRWQQLAQQAQQKMQPPPPPPPKVSVSLRGDLDPVGLLASEQQMPNFAQAQQAMQPMPQPGMPGQPPNAPQGPGGGVGPGASLSPSEVPMLGSAPPIAAGPGGGPQNPAGSDQENAAQMFEATQPQ